MKLIGKLGLFVAAFSCTICFAQEAGEAPPEPLLAEDGLQAPDGRAYVVFADRMEGETWSEKINAAIQRALAGGVGATVVLPPRYIEIDRPIKVWRQRVGEGVDTRAEGVELARLGEAMAAIKGGRPQDLARGLEIRGAGSGATRLIWTGGPNQVVIDMPAPWDCSVNSLSIDGQNAEGLIGLRYRAGWEFGINGGKRNTFDDLVITRVRTAIHVGDPFIPDLVGGDFRNIHVSACVDGFRFVSGNVAEMWVSNAMVTGYEEAGFRLMATTGRAVRSIEERGEEPDVPVFTDSYGNEIFLEQIPEEAKRQKLMQAEHPEIEGSVARPWVGGGSPTVVIQNVVAHAKDPRAWLVDAYHGRLRLQGVRSEGPGGLFRARGGSRTGRFNDILIDVNAVTPGNQNGYVIEYDRPGPLYMLGGTLEGIAALGQNALVYDLGVKFVASGRKMPGVIPLGAELVGDLYQRTGEETTIPHRGTPGEAIVGYGPERVGFIQKPGTSGARVLRLQEGTSRTVAVPAGETSVRVALEGLERQADAAYQVSVMPNWRAGDVWVSDRAADGFTVNLENAAPEDGAVDVIVRRGPIVGSVE